MVYRGTEKERNGLAKRMEKLAVRSITTAEKK